MQVSAPQSPGAQLWLSKHHDSLLKWIASGFADDGAAQDAARTLRFVLEHEPAAAAFVTCVAAGLGFQHGEQLSSVAARDFADVGELAASALPTDATSLLLRAWLTTDAARADLKAGRVSLAAATAFHGSRDAGGHRVSCRERCDDRATRLRPSSGPSCRGCRARRIARSGSRGRALRGSARDDRAGARRGRGARRVCSHSCSNSWCRAKAHRRRMRSPRTCSSFILRSAGSRSMRRWLARSLALAGSGADAAMRTATEVIGRYGVAGIDPLDVALVVARATPKVARPFSSKLLSTATHLGVDTAPYRAVTLASEAQRRTRYGKGA